MKTAIAYFFGIACAALSVSCAASESDNEGLEIGARRGTASSTKATPPKREWLKAGLSDSAYQAELYNAVKMLANEKLESSERFALQESIVREKERAVKGCLWLMDWKNCADPAGRIGAVAALGACAAEPKVAGKPLAVSAIFDPDEKVRKAAAAQIKARKDTVAEKSLIETWKSSFDEQGVLDANEARRKASVAAMREVGEKNVYQALLWYAQLELRAQTAAPVRIDTVNITGQGINLPIELPVIDIISTEGTIVVPALASLKAATGQDFGRNIQKWNEWIGNLK